jgi:hypothetical protein
MIRASSLVNELFDEFNISWHFSMDNMKGDEVQIAWSMTIWMCAFLTGCDASLFLDVLGGGQLELGFSVADRLFQNAEVMKLFRGQGRSSVFHYLSRFKNVFGLF